jgi:hypothetical protein
MLYFFDWSRGCAPSWLFHVGDVELQLRRA